MRGGGTFPSRVNVHLEHVRAGCARERWKEQFVHLISVMMTGSRVNAGTGVTTSSHSFGPIVNECGLKEIDMRLDVRSTDVMCDVV